MEERDGLTRERLRRRCGTSCISGAIRRGRLRWFDNMDGKDENDLLKHFKFPQEEDKSASKETKQKWDEFLRKDLETKT